MKVVIIGGGTAGMAAATHLRRINEDAEIVILEKSDEFAIATCGLSYYLSGVIKDKDDLTGATIEQMKNVFKIEVKLKHEVLSIDRGKKLLTVEGREPESYDKLILATGALQLRPDIEGILGDNIFTLRTLRSAERIRDYYYGTNAQKVIIVGAGDIGIELAVAFIHMGAEVHVIEKSTHVLPHFDYDMAAGVQNNLRDHNVHLHLSCEVSKFEEAEAMLSDGTRLKFDMAIIATGVKPDVKLPIMADLNIGSSGAIAVNAFMQTNDTDIYACGNNAETTDLISGEKIRTDSSSLAIKQARVAVEHISGRNSEMCGIITTAIVKIFDLTAASAGANEAVLQQNLIDYRKIHLFQNDIAGYMPEASQMLLKLLFTPQGKLLGVEGVGRSGVDTRVDVVAAYIKKGGNYQDLIDAETAYAPPYSTAKDAINNLGSLAEGVVNGTVRYVYPTALDWTKVGNEIMLIDTRSAENFKVGHISHAVNFPIATLRENISSIPRNKQVILYCGYGYGAFNAYCILSQRGFDNIYLLSGSMKLYMEIALDEES